MTKAELTQIYGPAIMKRITKRKCGGDDVYSWAVFVDLRPWATGLASGQANYYMKLAAEALKEKLGEQK